MNTGCQGPFCHGTGGWCGCNCKCCPPPCCPYISVYFSCGTDCEDNPPVYTPLANWGVKSNILKDVKLPNFDPTPITSEDGRFTFGSASEPCESIPCTTVCVELSCGGITPCCCLELLDGKIYSVGNGYVTAPATVPIPDPSGNCGEGIVLINGMVPPVFVLDCQEVKVDVISEDPYCCVCNQVAVLCAPCPLSVRSRRSLLRRKIDPRTGKTKINPQTGKPIIYINKSELKKRIMERANKLKRRRKQ